MEHLVGLLGGLGLFLVWSSCWHRDPVPAADRDHRGLTVRLRETLVRAGLARLGAGGFLIGVGAVVVLVFAVVLAISRSPVVAAMLALVASLGPFLAVSSMARARQVQLREVWPEAVDHLASGVRAGLSLPEALAQLGDRGPEALRPEFTAFARDFHASGHFTSSLDRLKDRLADPVADRIVEALRITREVGGSDLGAMLRTLSAFLRQDARTRAELEARQSWTVNAARLALAAPWIVLAMMATRPEAAAAYNSATGALVLAVGAVVSVIAYRVMVRIARLPGDERVLR